MGIFDKFRKSEKNTDVIVNTALKNSNTAVNYAKSFKKNFDYSKTSIIDLEEILNYYSNDISKSKPT